MCAAASRKPVKAGEQNPLSFHLNGADSPVACLGVWEVLILLRESWLIDGAWRITEVPLVQGRALALRLTRPRSNVTLWVLG
eukprot:1173668-Amphidinium_carterae.1